jgi:hypothetical protein
MSFAPLQFNNAKTTSNPLVVSAFLCSSAKRHLETKDLPLLAAGIVGAKITTNSITFLTGNPLINMELKLHREALLEVIKSASEYLHQSDLVHKKITFR